MIWEATAKRMPPIIMGFIAPEYVLPFIISLYRIGLHAERHKYAGERGVKMNVRSRSNMDNCEGIRMPFQAADVTAFV
jgi:hypothetical protein